MINKESSCLKYWEVDNLYAMSQKSSIGEFIWVESRSEFNEDFINDCNEDSDIWYFLEVDVQYPEWLHEFYNALPFLPVRMKIRNVEKVIADLSNKKKYVAHILNLKASTKSWTSIEKNDWNY